MEFIPQDRQDNIIAYLQDYLDRLAEPQECQQYHENTKTKLIEAINVAQNLIKSGDIDLDKIQNKLYFIVLNDFILEIQENVVQFREVLRAAIAESKKTQQIYDRSQAELNIWQQRRKLALSQGDLDLANEALERQESFNKQILILEASLEEQDRRIEVLKKYLIKLETKFTKVVNERSILQITKDSKIAFEELQKYLNSTNTDSTLKLLDSIKDVLLELENIKNDINSEKDNS